MDENKLVAAILAAAACSKSAKAHTAADFVSIYDEIYAYVSNKSAHFEALRKQKLGEEYCYDKKRIIEEASRRNAFSMRAAMSWPMTNSKS